MLTEFNELVANPEQGSSSRSFLWFPANSGNRGRLRRLRCLNEPSPLSGCLWR